MSKNEIDLQLVLERLSEARTEEAIIDQLKSLVKGFGPSMYMDVVRANPYYVSVFEDVRTLVLEDVEHMKAAISEEIDAIDGENSLDEEGMQKLSNLKQECRLLLKELKQKEKEIMAIKV